MDYKAEKFIKNGIKEGLRRGQSVMNMLREFDRELYDDIITTEFDCYYNDEIADKVLEMYEKRRINNA